MVRSPIRAARVDNFGFSMSALQGAARYPDQGAALDKAVEWGAKWVRFDLSWSSTQTGTSTYSWTAYDTLVDNCVARGLKPLLILDYNSTLYDGTGDTVAAESKVGIRTSGNRNAFTNWAVTAVARYKDRVSAFEIWNEPNTAFFWSGQADPATQAGEYVSLVQQVYPALKAESPSATVVVGAFANSFATDRDPATFLEFMYAAGLHGYFDAISTHPYCSPTGPANGGTYTGWMLMNESPWGIRDQMVAAGDADKKIWGTEFGAPTGGTDGSGEIVTEAAQAAQLAEGVRLWKTYPWAGVLFVHTLRNPRDQYALTSHEHHYGLLYTSGGTYQDSGKSEWEAKPGASAWLAAVRTA